MSRSELETASNVLDEAAADAGGKLSDRLTAQAETVASLAAAKRGPDHGRLARLEHSLREIQEAASEPVAAKIDDALEHIRAYRETVEGV